MLSLTPIAGGKGPRRARRRAAAFTLLELLAVIVIVGVVAGLVIPVGLRARDRARESQCLGNLRQLGVAAVMFSADYRDHMPDLNWWAQELLPYLPSAGATKDAFWCPGATMEENPLDASRNLSRYVDGGLIPIGYGINGNYPSNDGHIPTGNMGSRGRRRAAMEAPSRVILFAEQGGGYANLYYNTPERFSQRHARGGAQGERMQIHVVHIDASAKRIDVAYSTTTGGEWRRVFDPR